MSIEQRFDVPLIARLARREKQLQQNYRPVIGVHKWFARRPGALFRGLLLAEFGKGRLEDDFFRANDLSGRRIGDPFMGGGTPLVEANRVGCDVEGFDINPMAAWIVREEIERIDLDAYRSAAADLLAALRADIGPFYRTSCPLYGDPDVPVKSFVWVKLLDCGECGRAFDLFPGYLLAANRRHPREVLVCPACGDLNEVEDRRRPGNCRGCGTGLRLAGPARRGRAACPRCGASHAYPATGGPAAGRPPRHRLFAIEYHNPRRRAGHRGRFFKKPDAADLARMDEAARRWKGLTARFVPDERIPPGDETGRLRRWGYARYRDLFNERQLLALETSCRLVDQVPDDRIRRALSTNLSDLLRYQNMLCRYDAPTLKCLDIFSVHGFPVGLVQCEPNFLGVAGASGAAVGSGGWSNIIRKYRRAKEYCEAPFEIRRRGSRNDRVRIEGEWIGERRNGQSRKVAIRCADAAETGFAPGSLDAVFTDPPYFGNVQYGELMDFCYVWLRRLAGGGAEGFGRPSTRSPAELTGNATAGRGLEHFTGGLAAAFSRVAIALKPGAPLAFTYHHNRLETYAAVGVAILDAGLACTAVLPCPTEMGGSIHIHGTASSVVDTVFVCRSEEGAAARRPFERPEELLEIAGSEVASLAAAGRRPTHGDTRCILFGHLTRMAVRRLRPTWDRDRTTADKIAAFLTAAHAHGDPDQLAERARNSPSARRLPGLFHSAPNAGETPDAVSVRSGPTSMRPATGNATGTPARIRRLPEWTHAPGY